MREIPEALAVHLKGEATTTCHAWRLTRRDGTVMGFTEHDRDLEFDGTVFAAMTGFADGGEVETGLGLSADAAEVVGAFSAEAITRADLAAGRYDGALVETFLVNWQSPDDHVLRSTRELGEVRNGPDAFQAELRSLAAKLDRPGGRIYARGCDAELGDARCRVNLDDPRRRGDGGGVRRRACRLRSRGFRDRLVPTGADPFCHGRTRRTGILRGRTCQ